jgi:predicted dehydrogenase
VSELRVGLVGLGAVAKDHINGFERMGVPITAVCDVDPALVERVGADLGARTFVDYRDLLNSGEVDAVDILLPHHLHEEVAHAAIASKLHVLIEKPAARSSSSMTGLIDAAAENGVTFAVAENTRFVGAYNAVRDLISEGALGTIEVVRTAIFGNDSRNLSNPADWRGRRSLALGGAMFDGGAHSFYLLEWLFQGALNVSATSRTFTPGSEVEDFAVATGELRSGGSYTAEFMFAVEAPWSERLEVYGSKGSCIVDQLTNPVLTYFRDGRDWGGTPTGDVAYDPTGWKAVSIEETVVDFVEALRDGRPYGVDAEHIRQTMGAIDAAYESANGGGVVVQTTP